MISRCTSTVPKGDVVFPRLLHCDSRCSQVLPYLSFSLPDLSLALPELLSVLPDLFSALPDLLSALPDLLLALPDLLSALPELSSALPDLSSALPDLSSALPDLSSALPDLSSALPGLLSELPGLSQTLPGAPNVHSGAPRCSQTYYNHSHGTPVPVITDPSYSEGRPECPPSVWYSPEIDASKFTHHILSGTPGVFQWLKYILLMLTVMKVIQVMM